MDKFCGSGLCLVVLGAIAPSIAFAQILPDATLPNNSTVNIQGQIQRITGGTETENNLFHSFDRFDLLTGETAYFDNALNIENIITRITGGQLSTIDGLIRANGTANLFLLNPNGIVFEENARLEIGGSFFGSTAESLVFADGSFYSAVEPNAPPLLTINVPIGLQMGANSGSIVNRSIAPSSANSPNPILALFLPPTVDLNRVGLAVSPGETLALIGGEIHLAGGNLTASNGQIVLRSLERAGVVNFAPTQSGWGFADNDLENSGNITLSDGSFINTSGAGGGSVKIAGGNVILSGSRILAIALDDLDGEGIEIAARKLRIEAGSQLLTPTLSTGTGGKIHLATTDSVELSGVGVDRFNQLIERFLSAGIVSPANPGITILASTFGLGNAGEIAIDTPKLSIENGVGIGNATFSAGNGGNVTIRARVFEIVGSGIFSGTFVGSTGRGGNITFEGERAIAREGAFLASTSITPGQAGSIELHATDSIELLRTPAGSVLPTSLISITTDPRGSAGDATLTARRVTIAGGATISTSSGGAIGGQLTATTGGSGGNIAIRASESIEIFGVSDRLSNGGVAQSILSARTFSASAGGDIYLVAPRVTVRDGGMISASSLGAGNAGNIEIDANWLDVNSSGNSPRPSSITATSGMVTTGIGNPDATASAGSIELNADRLSLGNRSTIAVRSTGSAAAGRLQVVGDRLSLERDSLIEASTDSGLGGNISIQVRDLQLRRGSEIRTDAGDADGGSIAIDTTTLTALENSDISANSTGSRGGNITINARGIFGTTFRLSPTANSDITATGRTQQDLGTVVLNTPELDTNAGLVEFSQEAIDVDRILAQNPCGNIRDNSFTLTGRGSLPADPRNVLNAESIWQDWRIHPSTDISETVKPIAVSQAPAPQLIEAQGWIEHPDGTIELVVRVPASFQNFDRPTPNCGELSRLD